MSVWLDKDEIELSGLSLSLSTDIESDIELVSDIESIKTKRIVNKVTSMLVTDVGDQMCW